VFINLFAVIALYVATGAAIVLIFFPAYVWAWRSIASDFAATPGKNASWVRTCPIYLTIFLAGLTCPIDLRLFAYVLAGSRSASSGSRPTASG